VLTDLTINVNNISQLVAIKILLLFSPFFQYCSHHSVKVHLKQNLKGRLEGVGKNSVIKWGQFDLEFDKIDAIVLEKKNFGLLLCCKISFEISKNCLK
jgi:hypothetical protein